MKTRINIQKNKDIVALGEKLEYLNRLKVILTTKMDSVSISDKRLIELELKNVNAELKKVEFSIREQESNISKAREEYQRLKKLYDQDIVRLNEEQANELAKLNKQNDEYFRIKKEFEDLEAKRFQKYSEDMKRYFENFSPNKKGVDEIEFQKYFYNAQK